MNWFSQDFCLDVSALSHEDCDFVGFHWFLPPFFFPTLEISTPRVRFPTSFSLFLSGFVSLSSVAKICGFLPHRWFLHKGSRFDFQHRLRCVDSAGKGPRFAFDFEVLFPKMILWIRSQIQLSEALQMISGLPTEDSDFVSDFPSAGV